MEWLGSGTATEWLVFSGVVGVMLFIDLFVLNRKDHIIGTREALLQTAGWVSVALAFGGWLWVKDGSAQAVLYLTGFVIEKALSVDNLFVFLIVFSYFRVDPLYQRRVLSWGILSAVVLRGVLIFVGAWLIEMFHWILYLFGAFLLYTAWKLLTKGDDEVEPAKNPVLRLLRRFVPMTDRYHGHHFFTRENGKLYATPMLAVLAVIETTDVVFALDSVPAIFAVTTDPFLVYTSNVFAILGLRALYFALASMMGKFRYLNVGLSLVLAFVGGKMLAEFWHVNVPPGISLGIVLGVLTASVVASLLNPAEEPRLPPGLPEEQARKDALDREGTEPTHGEAKP